MSGQMSSAGGPLPVSRSGSIVTIERFDAIYRVTLNQPERRNALAPDLRDALTAALEEAASDSACRVVVLAGSGGSFCAGGDLSTLPADDTAASRERMRRAQTLLRLLVTMGKPVLALVDGAAFGAGMSLALACDYVVCTERAKFCTAFGKVGLMADTGMLWSLPQRVGAGEARRLLFTGAIVESEEALTLGLADRRLCSATALYATMQLAQEFSGAAPLAVAMTKAALCRLPAPLQDVLDLEMDGQSILFSSADFKEGRRAFLEKRRPRFDGR